MSDVKGGGGSTCNDKCGCPSPCPGGVSCRCSSGDPNSMEHKQCPCGEHCGCNPCTCSKTSATESGGTGKAFCKCGPGCACPTCTCTS